MRVASLDCAILFAFMGYTVSAADSLCHAKPKKSVSGNDWSLIQVRQDKFTKGHDAGTIVIDSHNHKDNDNDDHHKNRNHHKNHKSHNNHHNKNKNKNKNSNDEPWRGEELQDLYNQEAEIFHYGSQKTKTRMGGDHFAAAHLWSSFLLDRSHDMTDEKLTYFFSGFCAVSGNPVEPVDDMRYRLTLDQVGGGTRRGYTYYCCWPCLCDMKDFVRVDTKTVTLKDGKHRQYHFLVYGNPCEHPEKLSEHFHDPFAGSTTLKKVAPAVQCDRNGKLEGATISDHGYIILSMFFHDDQSVNAYDEADYEHDCRERARTGYESGAGKIFQKLAGITPVNLNAAKAQ